MPSMLISGGKGFLGSHLVRRVLKAGYEITVVDDLSTNNSNVAEGNYTFIKQHIEDFETKEDFDYYVHLAARPSPDDYVLHPLEAMFSNSVGTIKMLEYARKSGSILFYTSSSETYGDAAVIPTPESYWGNVNFVGIRSCYDESKRFSESLCMAYLREHDVDVRIQRPFNTYGPGIRMDGTYGRVIPRFILQALRGENITIHGDGQQTRSFLYVDDWTEATWKMLTMEVKGEVFNIGSPNQISIIDLAHKIKNLTESESDIIFEEAREDDPRKREPDISKAREMLKWQPRVSLEDGLKKTIDFIRSAV